MAQFKAAVRLSPEGPKSLHNRDGVLKQGQVRYITDPQEALRLRLNKSMYNVTVISGRLPEPDEEPELAEDEEPEETEDEGYTSSQLEAKSKSELVALAESEFGLKLESALKKADMVASILEAQEQGDD